MSTKSINTILSKHGVKLNSKKGVSKRCVSWDKLKIGSKWKFEEVTYQYGTEVYTKVDKVNELCTRLKNL